MRDREDLTREIAAAGVRDPRLLEAVRETPRANFVPPELVEHAYLDRPLPIPHGQVTTQPSLSAKMIEALGLTGSERVLQVLTDINASGAFDLATLSVALREIRNLTTSAGASPAEMEASAS